MEMQRLKGCWEVVAGIIPNEPMQEYTKRFPYTSAEYEEDKKLSQDETTRFMDLMLDAHRYGSSLTNPSMVNWVRIDFIWF